MKERALEEYKGVSEWEIEHRILRSSVFDNPHSHRIYLGFPYFLRLNIIPFFVWTASYLSVHPWTDTWLAVGSVCYEHI